MVRQVGKVATDGDGHSKCSRPGQGDGDPRQRYTGWHAATGTRPGGGVDRSRQTLAKVSVVLLGVGLLGFSAAQNFNIALVQYPDQYIHATWNSTQMGEVAKEFVQQTGKPYNVWVVGVPYWVDTRLVAISAGFVGMDYAIWPQDIETSTLKISGPKLFILKADDTIGMNTLQKVYPKGSAMLHTSDVAGQEFYEFIVPEK